MELVIGTKNAFTVMKTEAEGVVLQHPEAKVFMPKDGIKGKLEQGDEVEAFVYIDHKKGLMADMREPKIDIYRADFVKVVERKDSLGVFVDIGLSKDMLVSLDELPPLKKQWPQIGDYLYCRLKASRRQMVATLIRRFTLFDYKKAEKPLEKGDKVTAFVVYLAEEGLVLFTREGHEVFVFYKHSRREHRLGEALEATITVAKDELRYNGTLIEQKENMLEGDALRIYRYLQNNNPMPFTDKSDPQEIFETFHMSKAAFKRALGRLYKEGRVELKKDKTALKEND